MKFRPVVIARTDARLVGHPTLLEAEQKAERLARSHPGQDFCVYVPTTVFQAPKAPVTRTEIGGPVEPEDDIPF